MAVEIWLSLSSPDHRHEQKMAKMSHSDAMETCVTAEHVLTHSSCEVHLDEDSFENDVAHYHISLQ